MAGAKRPPLRDFVTIRQRHQRLGQIALLDSDDYRTNQGTLLADPWDSRSNAHHQSKLIKSIFPDFSVITDTECFLLKHAFELNSPSVLPSFSSVPNCP